MVTTSSAKSDVRIKRGLAGLGLFAVKEFKKGEQIIEYTGERITREEADKRGGKYLFEVTDSLVIDGKDRSNLSRYINHSCRPNAEAEHDESEDRIYIIAKKKIKPGEEITYHYGREYFKIMIKPYGCKCEHCSKGSVPELDFSHFSGNFMT